MKKTAGSPVVVTSPSLIVASLAARVAKGLCLLLILVTLISSSGCSLLGSIKKAVTFFSDSNQIESITEYSVGSRIVSEKNGILQVRVENGAGSDGLTLSRKIDVRITPIVPAAEAPSKPIIPNRFTLGGSIFYQVETIDKVEYEVRVVCPSEEICQSIKVNCFVVSNVSPGCFALATKKGSPVLRISLPAKDLTWIDKQLLLVSNAAFKELDGRLQLTPTDSEVSVNYDPFSRHVLLHLSDEILCKTTEKETIKVFLPEDYNVIYDYTVDSDSLSINYAGQLPNCKMFRTDSGARFVFPDFMMWLEQESINQSEGLIENVTWHKEETETNLHVSFREPSEQIEITKSETPSRLIFFFKKKKMVQPPLPPSLYSYAYVRSFGQKGFKQQDLYNPMDVAVGPGNRVYVADQFNHCIKILDEGLTQVVGVVGGHGVEQGRFDKPVALAFDSQGQMVVADMMNNRIQIFDQNGICVRAFGEYGNAPGQLANPLAVTTSNDGRIFVADMNNRITIFDDDGQFLNTWGGPGQRRGEFIYPSALAFDNDAGRLYVADTNNNRIQVLSQNGRVVTVFKKIDGLRGGFDSPGGIAVYRDNLYISDTGHNRVVVLNKENGFLVAAFGNKGDGANGFNRPAGLFMGSDTHLYVADKYNYRVKLLLEKVERQ